MSETGSRDPEHGQAGEPRDPSWNDVDSEDAAPPGRASADDREAPEPEALRSRLEALRERILEVDDELIRRVGERRDLVLEAGRVKETLGLPVMDPGREARVVRRAAERARDLEVDEELVRDVIWRIIAAARQVQEGEDTWGPPGTPPGGGREPEQQGPDAEEPPKGA